MSEQVHTTEQLDLQELKEEIIRKVMMLPDKDVTEMLEFVKALTNVLLLTDLFHDRGDIIFREHPGAFQHIEDLVAPHTLINAAVFFKTDAVWMFLDFTAIGDQKTVIFQEVVDPQVWDIPQVGNTFCGEKAPQLIASAKDIPFWEIFLFDFRFVMS